MASLRSWTYVSHSLLAPSTDEVEVAAMLAAARTRNASLKVTGALIYTGDRFCQCLEGLPDAMAVLQQAIGADPRHDRIETLIDEPVATRCFSQWSLAHFGSRSSFVNGVIDRALAGNRDGRRFGVDGLSRLLIEIGSQGEG